MPSTSTTRRRPHRTDGVARAQLSKLFFGRLSSPGSARALTGGVCYCCKTAIATGSDGSIHAAWRHVYPGNIRDIAFTMSADGGRSFTPPVRVSEDRWVLDGCPENGPAIAVDASRRIHVVWPTLIPGRTPTSEPTLGLFYARHGTGVSSRPVSAFQPKACLDIRRSRSDRAARSSLCGMNRPAAGGTSPSAVRPLRPPEPCNSFGSRSVTASQLSTRPSPPPTTRSSSRGRADRPDRRSCGLNDSCSERRSGFSRTRHDDVAV